VTLEELKRIYDSVGYREGWDFSRVSYVREPTPFEYEDIVQSYLKSISYVLDIGTGGGEGFIEFASFFERGVGIDSDPNMIQKAKDNIPPSYANKVYFEVMSAENLKFPDNAFNIVLNRHSSVYPEEIIRVLQPKGIFITEQVGLKNTENICSLFGCGPGGEYGKDPSQEIDTLIRIFKKNGCTVIMSKGYNVRYWFCDLESLIFWLKGIPIPEDFSIKKHWRYVNRTITEFNSPKGIETNEHRELLIVKKNKESIRL